MNTSEGVRGKRSGARGRLSLHANAGAFGLLLGVASQAVAQDRLEEVTVTATRTAESITRVPLSITALTPEQMDAQRINRMDDVSRLAPGVQFQRGNNNTNTVSIRGIASNIGAGTTGIYIDDTPIQTRRAGLSFTASNAYPEVFDIERIEVLRGPQGTLFGAGSVGGAVRFISPQPSLDTYTANARAETSFTSSGDPSHEVGLAAGGPLIVDKLGFRVSGRYRRDGGFVDRIDRDDLARAELDPAADVTYAGDENSNWQDSTSARLALTYAPIEALQITPSIFHQDIYVNDVSDFWEYYSDPDQDRFINANGAQSNSSDRMTLSALNVQYEFASFSVVSNSSYLQRKNLNRYDCTTCIIQLTPLGPQPLTPTQFLPSYPDFAEQAFDINKQKVFTQEVRAQSIDGASRWRWVVGAFYQDDEAQNEDFVPLGAAEFDRVAQALGAPSYLDLFGVALLDGMYTYRTFDLQEEKQYAAFADVTFEVVGGLKLTGGVRVGKSEFDATSRQGGPFAGTSTMQGFSASRTEDSVTPKLSVGWQATDDSLVYTTVAKGFRGGGVNQPLPARCSAALQDAGLTDAPEGFDSDEAWSYEIGTKNRLVDGRLNISASVFYIEWEDIQRPVYLGLGCNRSVTLNAATAISQGFDLQGAMAVTDALTVELSMGYTDAKYDGALLGSVDPITGSRPVLINDENVLSSAGPWMGTVALNYEEMMFGQDVFARIEYQYNSAQHDPTEIQDPSTTSFNPNSRKYPKADSLNLRAGIQLSMTELAVFVDNLTNEHPMFQTDDGDEFNSTTRYSTYRPRTFGVTATFRY